MVSTSHTATNRTALQKSSMALGVIFLLVGVLGFIPGITSDYGSLGMAGHTSEALLLGVFQVSVLHNLVHLLFGAAGLLMARSNAGAKAFLLYGGIIYLVLWIYGLLVGHESAANFVPLNSADNWLHLLLGLAMVALALILSRDSRASRTSGARPL